MSVVSDVEVHVRDWRKFRRRTLLWLATATGISKTFLNDAERGRTDFRVSQIPVVARALEASPHQLVTYRSWACPCCCHWQGVPKEVDHG